MYVYMTLRLLICLSVQDTSMIHTMYVAFNIILVLFSTVLGYGK